MRLGLVIAALGLCGCEAITSFDLSRAAETSNALCSDGLDNDGDGLADCQDWKCLGLPVCCDMPVVVLADDFSQPGCAATACAAADGTCQPDPARWNAWGLPLPLLCDGGLSPHKQEACYDVGVTSVQALPLHAGLVVTAHLIGSSEPAGRLAVGLVLDNQVVSGVTACSPLDPPTPVISVRESPTAAGYTLTATFDHVDLASAPAIADAAPHEVRLSVGDDRRAHYAVDGVEFAASPADQPFPASAPDAYLYIAGRGLGARVDDVRVVDGTQCEAPGAWTPDDPAVAVDASGALHAWDSVAVFAPAVTDAADGSTTMYFSGCDQGPSGGCSNTFAEGRATSANDGPFVRDPDNPRLPQRRRVTLDLGLVRGGTPGPQLRGLITTNPTAADQYLALESVTDDDINKMVEGTIALRPGAPGSWDDGDVCCATAVDTGAEILVWYAGRSLADPTWRIGLARSLDGVNFVKERGNPVLDVGARDAFDGHGVGEPEVVWDDSRHLYRMWYTAEAFLGVTSIGYAVSADGVHFSKYPGNPVLTRDLAGLDTIGSAAVVVEEGRTRLWATGHEPGRLGDRIYGFVNRGVAPAH